MEALTGLNPFVVIVLASIAAYAGWPYAQQYLPILQALFTRVLAPQQPSPVAVAQAVPADSSERSEPVDVPLAVVHLVALERQLDAAGVSVEERAALVDPLWPRVVRPKVKE